MSIWGDIGSVLGDVAEAGRDWLLDPVNRPDIIGAGVALYNHNNPPATRSLPPIQGPALPPGMPPGIVADRTERFYGIDVPAQPAGGSPFLDLIAAPDSPARLAIDYFGGGNDVAGNQAVGHSQHSVFARPAGGTGVRMASEVQVIHPITGKQYTYKNMGRCILFQGDLSATKRVNKIASRAKRARGKR